MKTKHWPRSRYMYAHILSNIHTHHAWCLLSWGRRALQTQTSTLSLHDNIHTRHDTWDRNSILTSYNQWNKKQTKKKTKEKKGKDHCEAKRWTVNSELLRGRSKHFFCYILVCYPAAEDPSSHASQLFLPKTPSLHSKSAHLLLSSGFVLFEQPSFTLRTQRALQNNKWHEEQMSEFIEAWKLHFCYRMQFVKDTNVSGHCKKVNGKAL